MNTNGQGGIEQSGVTSQAACQARCDGSGLQAGLTCYGYDINVASSRCYIFTTKQYVLSPSGSVPGVNHYTKQADCGGSGMMVVNSYVGFKSNQNLSPTCTCTK